MSWLSPLPVRDAYDAIMRKLDYPSSVTLRKILELTMSLEEAELILALPGTAEAIAAKLNRDPKSVKNQLERMFDAGLVQEMVNPDGTAAYIQHLPAYCIESASDNMMWAIGAKFAPRSGKITAQDLWTRQDKTSLEICDLWNKFFYEEWYRWQRTNELVHRNLEMWGGPGGLARSFGILPSVVSLMKSEPLGTEILPDVDLREFAKKGEKGVYSRVCTCRVRAKGCDAPLWVCGALFDGMPGRDINAEISVDRRGHLHKYSGEEWLEVMIRSEQDDMIIHNGDSWTVVCNCCRDCCNWLVPLRTYSADPWEGVHPSPYRAVVNNDVCEGCTQDCFSRCAFKVIVGLKDPSTGKVKAYVDPDKCVGCGQCVVGCKVDGAIKMELAEKAGSYVPVMGGRAKVPDSIPGFKPKIPRSA